MRTLIAYLNLCMSVLLIFVGVLHFVMMEHLEHLIRSWVYDGNIEYVQSTFSINHVGAGVLLLLIGAIHSFVSRAGLQHGRRWAGIIALATGVALIALSAILWFIAPTYFTEDGAFRIALFSLSIAGAVITIPLLVRWRDFSEQ